MKLSEIEVGGRYTAKVSGRTVATVEPSTEQCREIRRVITEGVSVI